MPWNDVLQGDCISIMDSLPERSVDLVFADPPFNIGYEYDVYQDRRSKADYMTWTDRWLLGVRRLLKPNG